MKRKHEILVTITFDNMQSQKQAKYQVQEALDHYQKYYYNGMYITKTVAKHYDRIKAAERGRMFKAIKHNVHYAQTGRTKSK